MQQINVNIYPGDTENILKNRIAFMVSSLPRYISIVSQLTDIQGQQSINYYDLISLSKEDGEDNINFSSFYSSIKDRFDLPISEILDIWIIFNESLDRNTYQFSQIDIDNMKDQFERVPSIEELSKNKGKLKDNLSKKVSSFKKEESQREKIRKEFEQVSSFPYSKFVLGNILEDITLNSDIKNIYVFFDSLTLTNKIPFASLSNFYKISNELHPETSFSGWIDDSEEDKILLKIKGGNEYENIFISYQVDEKIHISSTQKNVDYLPQVIPNFDIQSSKFDMITGEYYIPSPLFDKYIFADLVMNNDLFSKYLIINESAKASRKRNTVRLLFTSESGETLVATLLEIPSLTPSVVSKINPEILPSFSSSFIKVSISAAKNNSIITYFQEIFGKLYSLYLSFYPEISSFYKSYIPSFIIKKEVVSDKPKRLKDIVPDLFVSNYSRQCLDPPVIINQNEIDDYEKRGYQVMKFPRDDAGLPQHYYICQEKKGRKYYPGVKKNKLTVNKDRYPYVPCCYPVDQMNKSNSKYNQYFGGQVIEKKKQQSYVFISKKFAPFGVYGEIPEEVSLILTNLMKPKRESNYMRKGVSFSPSSSIECVLEATQQKFRSLTESQRVEIVKKERDDLINSVYLSVAKQEMYDYDYSEISEYVLSNEYLDPQRVYRLLEEKYQINIFLFSPDGLLFPRFKGAYLSYEPIERKNIFLYVHRGSESDRSSYPQCELIIQKTKKGEVYYTHSKVQNLERFYDYVLSSYFLSEKITRYSFFDDFEILGQTIDSYGKTRSLSISKGGKIFPFSTDPIPPLNVPDVSISYDSINYSDILSSRFIVLGQYLINDDAIEIEVSLGNFSGYISISPVKKLRNIKVYHTRRIYYQEDSIFESYNFSRRIARYLSEYILWLFSIYLYENEVYNTDLSVISEFMNDKVVVKENKVYSNDITSEFSLTSDFFENDRLVLNSDELLKRLAYFLYLNSVRNLSLLLDYHKLSFIPNYYSDTYDFMDIPGQFMLSSDLAFSRWISEDSKDRNIISSSVMKTSSPYFFKNKGISSSLFILSPSAGLNESLDVSSTWISSEYNKRIGNPALNESSFYLYSYINSNNIKKYKVKEKTESRYLPKILGYKLKDKQEFSSLLEIRK